jgi:hypothetical protein
MPAMRMLRVLIAVIAGWGGLAAGPVAAIGLPRIRYVFIIVLENKGFDETFGAGSPAVYLSRQLTQQGQLLRQYYATGHVSLDNYITLVSGQAPNLQTQSDCQFFNDFTGSPTLDADGQAVGQGCVYPATVQTIGDQLEAKRRKWKGYMQDMGNSSTEPATCRHPALNARDDTQSARDGDQYAARHNPFVYFHSIIDSPSCDANVVPLEQLDVDLKRVSTTPNYAFITPNLCEDGHDAPCVDGRPGGLASADLFLQEWVPKILASRAFRRRGLLIVMFDEGEVGSGGFDSSACCNEPTGPNTALPGITGPGGGRVGAVLISRFIRPGSVNDTPYNHYALLRSVEDIFAVEHLGYAGQDGLVAFGLDVFNCWPRRLCR